MKMKKVLATLLAFTLIACALSIGAFAGEYPSSYTYYNTGVDYNENGVDDDDIKCYTGLDFNDFTNVWAKYNSETDKWENSGIMGVILTDLDGNQYYALYNEDDGIYSIYDPATKTYTDYDEDYVYGDLGIMDEAQDSVFIATLGRTNSSYLDGKLDWTLSEDGEYLTLTSLVENTNAGMFFEVDNYRQSFSIGAEEKGKPEYVSIRIRNRSSASKLSFGFITSNTNSGTAFMTRSVTDLEIEPNSDEWKVYTFSMAELNSAMAHEGNGTGSAWGAMLRTFAIFPFGFDAEDGEGAYKGAEMDIDYIVIGSKDFCTEYKSEIEALEDSVKSIELVSAPDKKVYHVGESLDLTGLQIKATYEDGSTDIITNCSAVYDLTVANESAVVTLKYGTTTTPLTYNVKVIGIDSIEIEQLPEDTTYTVSEIKDGLTADLVSGTTIKVTYTDGTIAEDVTPTFKNFSISSSDPGEQIVTINYYGSTATFSATVTTIVSIKVADIEKDLYYNDVITKDDLTITCVYSDGTESSLEDSGFADQLGEPEYDTTSKFGTIKVSVTLSVSAYDIEVTGTANATVKTPNGLTVVNNPDKTSYQPEDTLDTTGLVVAYDYGDGVEPRVIDNSLLSFRADLSEPGTKAVKVTDGTYTTTFEIKVEGDTTSTTSTTSTTIESTSPTTEPKSGCGSVIGIGAAAVIACATIAGVMVFKKKED